jgi:hypothetical protein
VTVAEVPVCDKIGTFENVIAALAKPTSSKDKIPSTNKLNDLLFMCNHFAVKMVYKFSYFGKYSLF